MPVESESRYESHRQVGMSMLLNACFVTEDRRLTVRELEEEIGQYWRFYVAYVMLCGANDRICGQQKLGSSICDNAPAHSAHLIQSFLTKNNTPTWLSATAGYFLG
ncbi:hypothetical protein J6590_014354 [Homalodisca vitripennis]|nr:hypothetical protein J6590_014354 [Homalodisca vitripennis]